MSTGFSLGAVENALELDKGNGHNSIVNVPSASKPFTPKSLILCYMSFASVKKLKQIQFQGQLALLIHASSNNAFK